MQFLENSWESTLFAESIIEVEMFEKPREIILNEQGEPLSHPPLCVYKIYESLNQPELPAFSN